MKDKIIICGGGSQSMAVIDIILENKDLYDFIGIVDLKKNRNYYLNSPFIGNDNILPKLNKEGIKFAFPAIGFGDGVNNSLRKKIYNNLIRIGFKIPNLISKHAIIKNGSKLGKGNLIQAGSIIDNNCTLKNNISIGLNVTIGHNSIISNHVTLSGGVITNGGTKIGEETFVGMGAVIYKDIGKNCKIAPNVTILEKTKNSEIVFNGSKNKKFKN